MNVLIVEDELPLATILQEYLQEADFNADILGEGTQAVKTILEGAWDLILLDLQLPGKDGLSICQEVRQHSEIPIIILTARVEEVDRLIGLRLGADDYICKPYSPREVVARVQTVLRRIHRDTNSAPASLLKLQKDTLTAVYNNKTVELTMVEANILETLLTKPARIFSRNELMEHAYSDNRIVNDRTIDSHITKLRKKLRDITGEEVIRSVYGAGYKLELP